MEKKGKTRGGCRKWKESPHLPLLPPLLVPRVHGNDISPEDKKGSSSEAN